MRCNMSQTEYVCWHGAGTETNMATRSRKTLIPESATLAPILAKRYPINDVTVPGLLVSVQPFGVNSFSVQWSRTGSSTIGEFPGMAVDAARRARARPRVMRAVDFALPVMGYRRMGRALRTAGAARSIWRENGDWRAFGRR
jgi:hypothetical protein